MGLPDRLHPALLVAPANPRTRASHEPVWVRWLLVAAALAVLGLFLMVPLARGLHPGPAQGPGHLLAAVTDADARSAMWLTLLTAVIAVPLNTVFGVAAAWAIAKFEFRGKTLITLIDLPFSVSPVVAGLIYVLVFGAQGWSRTVAEARKHPHHFRRARHRARHPLRHLPLRRARADSAHAGAGQSRRRRPRHRSAPAGWQTFWHVTLPNIKWGLLYGVILCNARAMGEFGAVSVVSGHIRGLTNTLPLHVEILYNDYQFGGRVRGRLAARPASPGHPGDQVVDRVAGASRGGRAADDHHRASRGDGGMSIQVIDLCKRFSRVAAVDHVSLTIPDGSLMALVGPSGSGKTTLLRIIAGLEQPDSGQVLLAGQDVTTAGIRERGVGFVFQHYALFRHLTVFENIAFGLTVRPAATRPSKAVIAEKVGKLLALIRLGDDGLGRAGRRGPRG